MSQFVWDDESVFAHKGLACRSNSLLPILCEWKICYACMLPLEGPLGLAVSHHEATWNWHFVQFNTGLEDVFGLIWTLINNGIIVIITEKETASCRIYCTVHI